MSTGWSVCGLAKFLILAMGLVWSSGASGQTAEPPQGEPKPAPRSANKPVIGEFDAASQTHPLTAVLKYARDSQRYVDQAVHNYSCRVTKRERIDDALGSYQYANLCVREETPHGVQGGSPFAAFVEFLAPGDVAGRKVLFVQGENENKLLVRRGGKRLSYVVISLDPHGPSAQHECRVPITDAGFSSIVGHMVDVLERHIEADPTGANTQMQYSASAKVNGRDCAVIRIVHPRQQDDLGFYTASVYIDQELHVPVRIEAYGWPDEPEQSPPLLAEYTYTDLKLNVDLGDETFHADAVRSR